MSTRDSGDILKARICARIERYTCMSLVVGEVGEVWQQEGGRVVPRAQCHSGWARVPTSRSQSGVSHANFGCALLQNVHIIVRINDCGCAVQ